MTHDEKLAEVLNLARGAVLDLERVAEETNRIADHARERLTRLELRIEAEAKEHPVGGPYLWTELVCQNNVDVGEHNNA